MTDRIWLCDHGALRYRDTLGKRACMVTKTAKLTKMSSANLLVASSCVREVLVFAGGSRNGFRDI